MPRERKRKEIKPLVWKSVPYARSAKMSGQRAAQKRLRLVASRIVGKKVGNWPLKKLLAIVAKHYGINGNLSKKWLYEQYRLGTSEIIVRNDPNFYSAPRWRHLRLRVLKMYGRKCMRCGETEEEIHVDHIKPRAKYPELEWEISNLQVLCWLCNIRKSDRSELDYRFI